MGICIDVDLDLSLCIHVHSMVHNKVSGHMNAVVSLKCVKSGIMYCFSQGNTHTILIDF